jgi:hypothetical protein
MVDEEPWHQPGFFFCTKLTPFEFAARALERRAFKHNRKASGVVRFWPHADLVGLCFYVCCSGVKRTRCAQSELFRV